MKGIITLRIYRIASLIALCIALPLNAGFKDWLSSKLPYKLPPEKLNFNSLKPPSAVEVWDRNGEPLFYLPESKLHFYRPLAEISDYLQKFVVLSEDAKFYTHEGFDVEEIENSLKSNLTKNKIKRGGSTITQQLAKNIFLDKKKTVTRKLFEVPWTMQLERDLSKKQILELYLNVIEWGPGIYGAEAASRHYFSKSAAEIDAKEALYLAMIIPNPPRFDGLGNPKMNEFIWSKCRKFAERIYSEKKITEEEKNLLLSGPVHFAPLNQEQRKYPLQHQGKYVGSAQEFKAKWGDLSGYIIKTKGTLAGPIKTFLDKHYDDAHNSIWSVPLVRGPVKDKRSAPPYLVYRDNVGVAAYKKLSSGDKILENADLKVGLSLENDFSLEEVFHVRPPQYSSFSSEGLESSGGESTSSGQEAL